MTSIDHTEDASRRPRWTDAAVVALLVLVDFVVFTLVLLHLVSRFQHEHNDVARNVHFFLGSDLAAPLVGLVWFLILLNGVGLCAWPRTRAVGLGLLGTSTLIAAPVVAWGVFTLATFSSG